MIYLKINNFAQKNVSIFNMKFILHSEGSVLHSKSWMLMAARGSHPTFNIILLELVFLGSINFNTEDFSSFKHKQFPFVI